ncbi:glycosyltransferase family 61 protein [Synechococcus sp. RSCCF101]|uniref:glycosyltransferase 61 family protein n=1 Tax=Synechococcus sp. RSCCF101 TaxID=2511069 RepID=UPI001248E3B4|nr:glycosyltransferase 61 family protein [Synechococcus sp. RSCCF101]QEY32406.1 glycosyltransferase family 61 protein [Synechococcus sp. RSCCF101]
MLTRLEQKSLHDQALLDLVMGHPVRCLRAWRELLLLEPRRVKEHLEVARASLDADALAGLRQRAIALLQALLDGSPGETEVNLLGEVLRGWGDRFLDEAPDRALDAYERAWTCGDHETLAPKLADLYYRQGMEEGAWALAEPRPHPGASPWPELPCPASDCGTCQTLVGLQARERPAPGPQADPSQSWPVQAIRGGAIWVHRHLDPWRQTGAVAVLDANGELQLPLCRLYPHPWAPCRQRPAFERHMAAQLVARTADPRHPKLRRLTGSVLAVADLSAENYFHWQLETLPRLGRCWRHLAPRIPDLRLWHNGGAHPWVHEGLTRLGIPPERRLNADRLPALQADWLLVPEPSPFGAPCAGNLAWLEQFWTVPPPQASGMRTLRRQDQPPAERPAHWIRRGLGPRRPVLGEAAVVARLEGAAGSNAGGTTRQSIRRQLQQVGRAGMVIAPHGAGMANLLAAATDALVVEIVNPAYAPPYFHSTLQRRGCRHLALPAAQTPLPLQELLYESPLAAPIDLGGDHSPAAVWLRNNDLAPSTVG